MHQNKKTPVFDGSGGRLDSDDTRFGSDIPNSGVRYRSRNRIPFGAVISTRDSREMTPYIRNIEPTCVDQRLTFLNGKFFGIGKTLTSKLHSIPKRSKQLRCLSYSIPLVCMLALFGLVGFAVGVNDSDAVFAADVVGRSGETTVSLEISGELEQETEVEDNVAYREHEVSVNVSNANDYHFQISYADGVDKLSGPTEIGGANNATLANMADNTWGYAWQNTSSDGSLASSADAVYQTVNTTPTDIVDAPTIDEGGNAVFSGRLSFVAKFADTAEAGHYTAPVLLSLAASPKKVASEGLGSIEYMQDVTPEICAKTPEGWTGTLVDKRGSDPSKYIAYTVGKLKDGNCWMTQNLRLPGGTTITTEDSDLNPGSFVVSASNSSTIGTTSYTLPTSSASGFLNDTAHNMYIGPSDVYGGYYSWCTATAGCKGDNGVNPSGNESAGSSICPKGWKLPLSGNVNDNNSVINGKAISGSFAYLLYRASIPTSDGASILKSFPYNFQPAGYYKNSSSIDVMSNGYYWSRTANGDAGGYNLYFDTSISSAYGSARRYGYSVRCVAEASSGFGGVYTMQEMTADVCSKTPVYPAEGSTGSLVDERDETIYTVAKIANKVEGGANCWMTQNLALDLEKYWNAETMTTVLSNVPSNSYFSDIGAATKKNQGFTQSNSNYNVIEYTNTTTAGSGENQLKVSGGTYDPSYGYYYSWCAATVGCKTSSGDAAASICPAGWQLPSGNTYRQWYNLLNGMNMASIATEPYKIPAAGGMFSAGFNYGGTRGGYWARTPSTNQSAYGLYFDSGSSYFYPGTRDNNLRYLGYSVRCVAKP